MPGGNSTVAQGTQMVDERGRSLHKGLNLWQLWSEPIHVQVQAYSLTSEHTVSFIQLKHFSLFEGFRRPLAYFLYEPKEFYYISEPPRHPSPVRSWHSQTSRSQLVSDSIDDGTTGWQCAIWVQDMSSALPLCRRNSQNTSHLQAKRKRALS